MVVALVVAVAVDVAGASPALAAGAAREPLHGRQGIVPPGATLIGPAPSTTTLPLVVTLQPRDPAALSAEVQAVSDPHSPEYRHFLTPQEFARRFGPTPSTVAQVASALRSQGLTVGRPAATGLSLPVSGTVAQVQSAFSTPISRYRLSSGKTGYDNRSAPEVPVTVAPQIEGILGLDTLSPPQPSTTVPQASSASPHSTTSGAAPTVSGQPTPTCSGLSGAQSSFPGALDADQLAQAYSFDPLYAANHYGAGATVALVEMAGAGYSSSDISTFAACYGITGGGQITQEDVDGGGAEGLATVESDLDIENVLSLAPQANIEVYEGEQSMYDVFSQIVGDHTAKIVSASWTNGCEAYVGQSTQKSESALFQEAAIDGQSIFVASGDEGSEGCNVNGEKSATTGTDPVAQAVDPSTGTLYIANKSSNTVSVDSEGSTSDPSNFATAFSVPTGSGPDAVALDSSAGEVFVANSGSSTLTEFSTTTCNQTTTSGCSSPTSIPSGGNLNAPDSLVVNGSTLYVGNNNGKVAVYSITASKFVATVTLPSSSHPTALAVDAAAGFVYVADGSNSRIEYFNATTCNGTTFTTCSTTPLTVSVGVDPVALAVASAGGDLYVGNAGTGGGITVVSLATHTVVKTISTTQPSNVTGLVQSIGMSPNNQEVLAVLTGPSPSGSSPYFFPGDVMATVNTSTRSISATVSLQNGWDPMGQLVSDGTRDYVWVLDESSGPDQGDLIQNLNLAVSDPASQPYVTAVGGTSLTGLGPAPTESVWNDQLDYSEGAGGGGISQTFAMPAYQQPLGTVSGSSGTPCASSGGDCREVPDVSADADPSTGYIVYDSYNFPAQPWIAVGGTSGAAPLWAAVLAVDASADGNTAGYGALNPALYLLAQQSAGTYLNDVTTGNNDYNATDGGSFPAMAGYDMATGLGTPVASQLATGLAGTPLDVAVSGSQVYGGTPTFTASANYAGSGSAPFGVTLNSSGLTCTEVGTSTTISPTLPLGSDTLVASSCSGVTLSGIDAGDYAVVYTSAANDFTVSPGPVDVAVSGTQSFGGTPIFVGTNSPPSGITVNTTALSCTKPL
jgi:subtilase family serine protease